MFASNSAISLFVATKKQTRYLLWKPDTRLSVSLQNGSYKCRDSNPHTSASKESVKYRNIDA
jgi:hypothetical protein